MVNSQDIYIIVVNYRTWSETIKCLESIESSVSQPVKIILVDIQNMNRSRENLSEWFKKNMQHECILLPLEENKGYAFACNNGIKYILNDNKECFIWVLNNDTTVLTDSLTSLVNCYMDCTAIGLKIGLLGSVLLESNDNSLIQYAGGTINLKNANLNVDHYHEKISTIRNLKFKETEWIMGASVFFHSSLINAIGFMPEDYFLYYEDVDWCITALKKGYKNLVCTESRIIHKQGSTTLQDYKTGKRFDPILTRYFYSNYLKFFRKHFPSRFHIAYLMLVKQMIGHILRWRIKKALIIFRVIFNNNGSEKEGEKY